MRTPVIVVAGQGDGEGVVGELLDMPGTIAVTHRLDGHVVVREVSGKQAGVLNHSQWAMELVDDCVGCTVRSDLLVLLRRLHRRNDVARIVVRLLPWLEPEPVCVDIDTVHVQVGPGYIDGPASRDVRIEAVVTCVDTQNWLAEAFGDDELDDGRTVAQVVVGQAEFADVLVLTEADPTTLAVLRRLTPRARITVGLERVELALSYLEPGTRRGRPDPPHGPLLSGEPALHPDGAVALLHFSARRPFHPERLHQALDVLLDGVVRTRGRVWLPNRPDAMMWVESAGGGMRFSNAGRWLAAMDDGDLAGVSPERRALAAVDWHADFGDRHVSLAILACGADTDSIRGVLQHALLTDDEVADAQAWPRYHDPFGDWHEEPCDELSQPADSSPGAATAEGDQRSDRP